MKYIEKKNCKGYCPHVENHITFVSKVDQTKWAWALNFLKSNFEKKMVVFTDWSRRKGFEGLDFVG